LNDGRIVYTRWDYVDRNAAKFHGLWTCNIDGTHPAILFGNYTVHPWASYQAKSTEPTRKTNWRRNAVVKLFLRRNCSNWSLSQMQIAG
jgi:hypothetical protein